MSGVTRSAGIGSGRLDASVAILALALPFALPVLIVAWMHPAAVVAPGSAAVASLAPYERQTANPTATTQPAGAVSPTRTPDASPATAPAPVPASDVPASDVPATDAPASTLNPTLVPTLTQPPTATVAGSRQVAADLSVFTGMLLLGGLGVVFMTIGRRPTRGRERDAGQRGVSNCNVAVRPVCRIEQTPRADGR